jgi:multidrug efflux pump subunit AcrA (membrane-fusion protein)
MYATVHFAVRRSHPALLIPAAAFRNTDTGPIVAVLGEGARVHLQPVQLGRDFGAQIEITAGLHAGQKVITTLTDEVREGIRVKPAAAKAVPSAGGGQAK